MKHPPIQRIVMLSPAEEAELINAWISTKDQKLLLKLMKSFEPLVLKFVRKFSSYGVAREELLSVGNLALVEVANRFEPERGLKFSTYASHWVRGTMLVYIASNYFSFAMKSQKMKKIFFHLRSLVQQERKKFGDSTTTEEIMNRMATLFGIEPYRLEQIYSMIRQPSISLEEPISVGDDGESITISDILTADTPSPEDAVIERSVASYREHLIYETMDRVLNERERTILIGQMLVDENEEQTLQELADQYGCSRERVRQIRNIAFDKLEKAIRRQCAHTDPRVFLNVSGRKRRKDVIENSEIVAAPEPAVKELEVA